MKKFLAPLFAALLAAAPAFAAEQQSQVSGTITQLDSGKHQITLTDGVTYNLPADMQVPTLKVGDRVTITAEKQDGASVVQRIARN
jgi:Cu/Ag efflux protein CusF